VWYSVGSETIWKIRLHVGPVVSNTSLGQCIGASPSSHCGLIEWRLLLLKLHLRCTSRSSHQNWKCTAYQPPVTTVLRTKHGLLPMCNSSALDIPNTYKHTTNIQTNTTMLHNIIASY